MKEMEDADKKAHISNTMNGHFLNEVSLVPRDWRGMSEGQMQRIFEERQQQLKDKRQAKNQAMQEECTWDNYFRSVENKAKWQLTALEDERKAIRKRTDELNKQTADERSERVDLNTIGKGAAPSKEWFDKFERDPR